MKIKDVTQQQMLKFVADWQAASTREEAAAAFGWPVKEVSALASYVRLRLGIPLKKFPYLRTKKYNVSRFDVEALRAAARLAGGEG